MQNATDLNLLQRIDRFIFGPIVAFEKQSSYGPAETIDRLRAARLSMWQYLFGFSVGLAGPVDPDRIRLHWRNPWTGHGFQPYFLGSIVTRGDTVTIVGTIGVPWYIKALVILPALFVIVFFWEIGTIEGLRNDLGGMPALFTTIFGALTTLSIVLPRVLKASDYDSIADAIDAAVT